VPQQDSSVTSLKWLCSLIAGQERPDRAVGQQCLVLGRQCWLNGHLDAAIVEPPGEPNEIAADGGRDGLVVRKSLDAIKRERLQR